MPQNGGTCGKAKLLVKCPHNKSFLFGTMRHLRWPVILNMVTAAVSYRDVTFEAFELLPDVRPALMLLWTR